MRFVSSAIVCLFTCSQISFAESAKQELSLQEKLDAARKEILELEKPVFENLDEIGFECNSADWQNVRNLLLENKMKERIMVAGLKVLKQRDDDLRDVSRPYLHVLFQKHASEGEVSAELTEKVTLKRNPKTAIILPTWRRRERFIVSANLTEKTEAVVEELVDEFISEYLAAKKKSK